MGRHILVVGGAGEDLGVRGDVVLVVPEPVAAAGNCHLRRGLLGIEAGPARRAFEMASEREEKPSWRRLWDGVTASGRLRPTSGAEKPTPLVPKINTILKQARKSILDVKL